MTIIYRKRNSLFKRDDTEWRVEEDALVRRSPEGAETRLRWADVRWVRLRYNPSLVKPWLHIFTVATAHDSLAINNVHFAGIGSFENRSMEYSALVRAALEHIATLSPHAKAHLGSTPLAFIGQLGFLAIAMLGLAAVLIFLPFPTGTPIDVIVKLVVIAASLPLLWRWIKKNWPRDSDVRSAAANLP